MDLRFQRSALLFGEGALEILNQSRVAVIGLGAVGSFCLEALARSGVGRFRLVDFDTLKTTNINRQLLALESTLGQRKVEAARERALAINPQADVEALADFMHADSADRLLAPPLDAVVDAIDSFGPKTELLRQCVQRGLPVFSGMGAAARTDPRLVRVADISQTFNCPLARRVRRRLAQQGITTGITAVFSAEPPEHQTFEPTEETLADQGPEYQRGRPRRVIPSSIIIPGIFGLTLASEVIKHLLRMKRSASCE